MTQPLSYTVRKASDEEGKIVLAQMMNGISSDPSSIDVLMGSWWKRLMFRYSVGPRMVNRQMDTFIAVPETADSQEEGAPSFAGYLILQYSGDIAGVFDWALDRPMDKDDLTAEELSAFSALLSKALDWIDEKERYLPFFYFGFSGRSLPSLKKPLVEEGMWLPDYQLVQMKGTLPLPEAPSLPEGITIAPKISANYKEQAAELIHLAYSANESAVAVAGQNALPPTPDLLKEDVDAIIALHESSLRSAKIIEISQDGEPIGFVQQHAWQGELRILLCLTPSLWGTDEERELLANIITLMRARNKTLRLRTFSGRHLSKSKEQLESMGLTWEEAPWQRWMVGL